MTSSTSAADSNSAGSIPQSDDRPLATPKTASLATSSNEMASNHPEGATPTIELQTTGDSDLRGNGTIQRKLSKLLKGKEEEWTAVAKKNGPLQLLDLPMDVLKEIVKEV